MRNYIPLPKACKTHSPLQELSQKHPELKPGELRAKAAKVDCPGLHIVTVASDVGLLRRDVFGVYV